VLDPKDWHAFRELSHAALDDALDALEHVREQPAWRDVPATVRAALNEPLPEQPTPIDEVYRQFTERIMPYHGGNVHPRFFGWVQGTGTPTGMLAEMLAAAMNPNVGGRNHGAVYVERAVIEWFRELFRFPQDAGGVLTAGTSAANLIAVLVARTKLLGARVRESGIDGSQGRLMGYASSATHGCVRRAFEVCGLGSDSLSILPCDSLHRIDPSAAARAIAEDRAEGRVPFMLVGNAGTVDVGAIDPLEELAELARREGLWFHVDGAFGATAMMSRALAPRLRGVERADSIAFDAHKWLHVPYDAGCLLVRDGALHRATFAASASYLTRMPRGLADAEPWFTDFTIDLSRSFRALKVWFTIKEHGTRRLGEAMEANVRQARLLGDLVDADERFELVAPVQLNVACFRYRAPGMSEAELDAFNDELVIRLQESGEAVTSSTTVGARRAIRACIVNQRTRDEDMHLLFASLQRLAGEMGIRPA
jgi:aromatic-L-amino-acid decarboxylase